MVKATPVDYNTPIYVSLPDGGSEYILYQGGAYSVSKSIPSGFTDSFNQFPEPDYEREKVQAVTKTIALAVAFVVPCMTIVVALICLLVFWLKRAKSKNFIIAKAIEHGYDLPDAFYTGQPSSSSMGYDSYPGNNQDQNIGQQSARTPFTLVPAGARDPKMFTSSVTLIAVGLALLLFFSSNGYEAAGFLCGGIPLFLGIGRMIAYLYIPGARDSRSRKGQPIPPHQYYSAPQSSNTRSQQFGNACPPPPPAAENPVNVNENNQYIQ